jgi:hypothetical protein
MDFSVLNISLLAKLLVSVVVQARGSSRVDGVLVSKEDGDLLEGLVSGLGEEEEDDDGVDDGKDDEEDPVLKSGKEGRDQVSKGRDRREGRKKERRERTFHPILSIAMGET